MGSAVVQSAQAAVPDGLYADEVQKAWEQQCSALRERDREEFQKNACSTIQDYLERLEAACKSYQETSRLSKIVDWFEPLHKAVELVTPAFAVGIQAYPNPGSLVLGGIVGLLSLTDRLLEYQKLTLRMLSRMGRKSKILLQYESQKGMFKDDANVRSILLLVYGDILAFCDKAFRFLVRKNGKLHARVKGFRLLAFRDYESYFEDELQRFDDHVEDLEAYANQCLRSYLEAMSDRERAHHVQSELVFRQAQDHFQRQEKLLDQVHEGYKVHELSLARSQRKDSLRWLDWLSSSDELTTNYDKKCEEHLPGTGAWLLESEDYKSWKSRDRSDLLWVTGKPGCGKSILAAVAVMDLNLDIDTPVAYAFCRGEEETSRDSSAIMGTLIKQLARQVPDLGPVLKKHPPNTRKPTHFALQKIVKTLTDHLGGMYLVIDGLDECMTSRDEGDDDFSKDLLLLLQAQKTAPLKILVFSRPEHQLEKRFDAFTRIHVDLGANEADLEAYIQDRFPDEPDDLETNRKLRTICFEKAQGMFLWVKLLWQYLDKENLHSGQKLARVSRMPVGLTKLYDNILEKIWKQDEDVRSTALLVLAWVIHGNRPLSGKEMIGAVADWRPGTSGDDTWTYPKPERLVTLCMNLVYLDHGGFFRLCHESAREYLENAKSGPSQPLDEYHLLRDNVHDRFARICLNYLSVADFHMPLAPWMIRIAIDRTLFIRYAAKEWGAHAAAGNASDLHPAVTAYLDSPQRREIWSNFATWNDGNQADVKIARRFNALHILCMLGLVEFAQHLPDVEELAQQHIDDECLPLSVAAYRGHLDMCEWLLANTPSLTALSKSRDKFSTLFYAIENGWHELMVKLMPPGDPIINHWSEDHGRTLLLKACESGHTNIAQTLLDRGADQDRPTVDRWTPLHMAVDAGSESIVRLLLETGADVHARTDRGSTPLSLAAAKDNVDIVNLLLQWPTGALAASARTTAGWTPLHYAASNNWPENIKAIHRVQPDLEVRTRIGKTPLHVANSMDAIKAFETLLDLGARMDAVDDDGRSVLWKATLWGYPDIVRLLLRAGSDISLTTSNGCGIFDAAVKSGNLEVVNALLKHCSPERRTTLLNQPEPEKPHEYPIHSAVRLGHLDIFRRLLDAGADISTKNAYDAGILHFATGHGRVGALQTILSRTGDANPRLDVMSTPLHLAAAKGDLECVEQFLDICAQLQLPVDLSALDRSERTPLMSALYAGHEDVAILLLKRQSSMTPDKSGYHPIHQAAKHGLDSVVRQLLDQEGVTAKSLRGWTPISTAASWGHLSTVKLLADKSKGVIDVPDNEGWTPLAFAISNEHTEIAHFLLDMGASCMLSPPGVGGDGALLHLAASQDDPRLLHRLIGLGCDLHARDVMGHTPLHCALGDRQLRSASILIQAGSDVNAVDEDGWTCVLHAVASGDLDIVRELAARGAQLDVADAEGLTPAWVAANMGYDLILKFFVEAGADITTLDPDGLTALLPAVENGFLGISNYLLEKDPTLVKQRDKFGVAAIHIAAEARMPSMLRLLLRAGADPCCLGMDGMNANDYALGHIPSLRELHRAGYFCPPTNVEERKMHLSRSIVRICKRFISTALPEWTYSAYSRRNHRLRSLSCQLHLIGDFASARICLLEIGQPPNASNEAYKPVAAVCSWCNKGKNEALDEVWTCQVCTRFAIVCKACRSDYIKAGNKTPDPVSMLFSDYSPFVRKTLGVLAGCSDLLECFRVMTYFLDTFPESNAKLFESWKEEYNVKGRFDAVFEDGMLFEFIDIMAEAAKLIPGDRGKRVLTPVDSVAWTDLDQKFQKYRRAFPPGEPGAELTCSNHTYSVVRASEWSDKAPGTADFDPETGLVTPAFFHSLIEKYDRDSQPDKGVSRSDERNIHDDRYQSDGPLSTGSSGMIANSASQHATRRRRASIAVTCPSNALLLPIGPVYELDRDEMLIYGPPLPSRRPRSLSLPGARHPVDASEPDHTSVSNSDSMSKAAKESLRAALQPREIAAVIDKRAADVRSSQATIEAQKERDHLLRRWYRNHISDDMSDFHLFELSTQVIDVVDPEIVEGRLQIVRDVPEDWDKQDEVASEADHEPQKPDQSRQHRDLDSDSDSDSDSE